MKHSRFGLGIIIDAEGRGTDARVQVNFRDERRQVAGAGICQAAAGVNATPDRRQVRESGAVAGARLVAVKQIPIADVIGNMQRRDEREKVRHDHE